MTLSRTARHARGNVKLQTIKEAAAFVHVHPRTIKVWIKRFNVTGRRRGSHRKIFLPADWLDQIAAMRTRPPKKASGKRGQNREAKGGQTKSAKTDRKAALAALKAIGPVEFPSRKAAKPAPEDEVLGSRRRRAKLMDELSEGRPAAKPARRKARK